MAKQLPLQAQRPVSIKDAKGRPLSQTDTPARPSAEHSVHAVGHALSVTHRLSRFTRLGLNAAPCKATRVKASMDDLPRRSGNGAQYLTLASSRPHSWRDSSVVRRHWWSRSTSVQRVQVFSDPDNYRPISLLSVPTSSSSRMKFHRPVVRRQLLEPASGAASVRRST